MTINPSKTLLPTIDGDYVYLSDVDCLLPDETGTLIQLVCGKVVSIDLKEWHLFLILNEPYTIWYKIHRLWEKLIKFGRGW